MIDRDTDRSLSWATIEHRLRAQLAAERDRYRRREAAVAHGLSTCLSFEGSHEDDTGFCPGGVV